MNKRKKCRGPKGIKYISLHESRGYYEAAKRYIIGLKNYGIPLTWTPMVLGDSGKIGFEPFQGRAIGDKELDPFCNKKIQYDTVIIHTPPDLYPLWTKRESGKRVIGYMAWETDRLPRHWVPLINSVDHLLVPCYWNKKVFEESGVTCPIEVIPHILARPKPINNRISEDIAPEDYVFYAIGSWTPRKSVWNTAQCYLNTFTAQDHVLLLVKTSKTIYLESPLARFATLRKIYQSTRHFFKVPGNLSIRPDSAHFIKALQKHYRDPARIKLITSEISEEDIHGLHQRGDCYVSLCRSEGWGLAAFDAALYGNPVIMTGFGGQLDFLKKDSAYLVGYKLVPVQDDEDKNFTADQKWAEPDISQASKLMRHVFQKQKEAEIKGRILRNYVRRNFQESVVIKALVRLLQV